MWSWWWWGGGGGGGEFETLLCCVYHRERTESVDVVRSCLTKPRNVPGYIRQLKIDSVDRASDANLIVRLT